VVLNAAVSAMKMILREHSVGIIDENILRQQLQTCIASQPTDMVIATETDIQKRKTSGSRNEDDGLIPDNKRPHRDLSVNEAPIADQNNIISPLKSPEKQSADDNPVNFQANVSSSQSNTSRTKERKTRLKSSEILDFENSLPMSKPIQSIIPSSIAMTSNQISAVNTDNFNSQFGPSIPRPRFQTNSRINDLISKFDSNKENSTNRNDILKESQSNLTSKNFHVDVKSSKVNSFPKVGTTARRGALKVISSSLKEQIQHQASVVLSQSKLFNRLLTINMIFFVLSVCA
jgi:hypothetical protein